MGSLQEELAAMGVGGSPEGGFGVPDLSKRMQEMTRDFRHNSSRASMLDYRGFRKAGMANSVAASFSGGTRRTQGFEGLMRAMMQLRGQDKSMKNDAYLKRLGIFAPLAYNKSQQPSGLSSALGGAFGFGLKALGSYFGGGGARSLLAGLFNQNDDGTNRDKEVN